jgi:hypothetical protein
MKTQFSSYLKYTGVSLYSSLLLLACSKDDGPGKQPDHVDPISPTEEAQLMLSASKTELNESDEVTFSVTFDRKAIEADIFIDDEKLNGQHILLIPQANIKL